MELTSIRQLILNDSEPIEKRLKAIEVLFQTGSEEDLEFLKTLLKNSNIQIRYFTKKILSDQKIHTKNPEKKIKVSSSNVYDNEPVEVVNKENCKEEKSKSNKKFFLTSALIVFGILFIVISLITIGIIIANIDSNDVAIVSKKNEKSIEEIQKEKEQEEFQNLISMVKIQANSLFINHEYRKSYKKYVQLYNLLDYKMKIEDVKRIVECMETFNWKYFYNEIRNKKDYPSKQLSSLITFVYEIKRLNIKEEINIKRVIDSLYINVFPVIFLKSKTISRAKIKSESLPKRMEKLILRSIFSAYNQKYLTSQAIISDLSISKDYRGKLLSIIRKIKENEYYLPESSVSKIKDKKFLEDVNKYLAENDNLRLSSLINKKIGKNKISSFIREIYYYLSKNFSNGEKILKFGISHPKLKNKSKLEFLLAKHYLNFNKIDKGISLLYSLYYNTYDSNNMKNIYFKTIKKTLLSVDN